MPMKGSYDWWRQNWASDAEYAKVAQVLTKRGVDCTQVEVDHFPPNAAYTGTMYASQLSYGARPAFPLPKYLHRYHKGGGGMGYHASSTGRTFVQSGWTSQLKGQMSSGSYYGAMRQDIVDKQNVALAACGDRHLFDGLMKPAVELAMIKGLISKAEAYEIVINQLGGL